LKLGITMLIHNKDDIQFVTEFPCFLGHPVENAINTVLIKYRYFLLLLQVPEVKLIFELDG